MSLYPKASEASLAPDPMDPEIVAARILEGMETGKITFSFTTASYGSTYELPGLKRGDFLGPCLMLPDDPDDAENPGRGSDDKDTFNQVWDEIHAEKVDLANVQPAEFDAKGEYVAALQEKATRLDPTKWADGTIAASGASDFSELKTKLTEV